MYKAILFSLLAAVPTSTNFTLQTYDFGSGADASSSSTYALQGLAGSPGGSLSSGTFKLPAGIRNSASVSVPPAATFINPDNSYNRLKITLNVSGIPADVRYLIAISDDNFVTTNYVQTDQTVGPSATVSNYQTYASWSGASGFWVVGLDHSTTYKVKVAALQGDATGSQLGPEASASTVAPSVTFAVSTSLSGSPPFNVGFGNLTPGSVTTGNATVIVDVTTNAMHGGSILVKSQNSGLNSILGSDSISSATADLAVTNTGYGAQITGTSQGGGGPISASNPFNGASANVGGLLTQWQQLASFGGSVTGGTITTTLKAKASSSMTAATDYSDLVGFSISLSF